MKAIKTIYNIAESIAKVTDREVIRLDIQEYNLKGIKGYSGYLYTETSTYLIRQDGTFEESEVRA